MIASLQDTKEGVTRFTPNQKYEISNDSFHRYGLFPGGAGFYSMSDSTIPVLDSLSLDGIHPSMRREVRLPNGRLTVDTEPSIGHIDELCEFAARINKRRGFLFVSRVLGRHLPARPSVMKQSWGALANLLPPGLGGPIVFFGMAETAIALGFGVYRSYSSNTGHRSETLYIHSTRYRFNRPLLGEFSEEHSHASRHFVYAPEPHDKRILEEASVLVMVDDEMTTGRTFHNALQCLKRNMPNLEHVYGLVLTDWSGGMQGSKDYETAALARGTYLFKPDGDVAEPRMPNVSSTSVFRDEILTRNDGRFGINRLTLNLDVEPIHLTAEPGERIAVVGNGEFVSTPFLIAEQLEHHGADVRCHSTTRSPAMLSHAMRCRETFTDHYGDGIPNFVYNLNPSDYDRILLCHETPKPHSAIDRLGAIHVTSIHL